MIFLISLSFELAAAVVGVLLLVRATSSPKGEVSPLSLLMAMGSSSVSRSLRSAKDLMTLVLAVLISLTMSVLSSSLYPIYRLRRSDGSCYWV